MNKKNFNRMVALICLALIAVPSIGKKWKAEHVFIIGLDGWGAYSVEKADMPNVKQLMNEGCYTLKKRSVLPSSSAVNWASMFMGAGPELHGYTEWGVVGDDITSVSTIVNNGNELNVRVSGQSIVLNSPQSTEVSIYTLDGKKAWQGNVSGERIVNLPKGVYLVAGKKVIL